MPPPYGRSSQADLPPPPPPRQPPLEQTQEAMQSAPAERAAQESNAIANATEHGLLLANAHLPQLRQDCGLGRSALHNEARRILEQCIFLLTQQRSQCIRIQHQWPHWKEYVAFHAHCHELVGPGVVDVTAQQIQGTMDPNRGGDPRVDLVLHHQDGGYVRLHPGSRPKLDAKPRHGRRIATDHAPAPHSQWLHLPPELVAVELWIANLAQHQAEVVGSGIQKAELVAVDARSAVVAFTRVDQSSVQVELTASRAGLTVRHATQQATGEWSPWQ